MRPTALLFLILGILIYSCENPLEDRVKDLENQIEEHEQQQALIIDSLINAILSQQEYIDSFDAKQQAIIDSISYIQQTLLDSINIEHIVSIDSLNNAHQAYIDSLILVQQETIDSLGDEQQSYIDSIHSLQEALIDSLNDAHRSYIDSIYLSHQNLILSHNAEQQELIDSLNLVQQELVDSLYDNQQAYIDSLIQEQQILIDMLISSQPSTGENYVRIDNVQICWGSGMTDFNGSLVTFPASFEEVPSVVMTTTTDATVIGWVLDITTSSATFYLNTSQMRPFNYQAIGLWR